MLIKDVAAKEAESVLATHWGASFPVDPSAIAERLGVLVRRAPLPADTSGLIMKRQGEDAEILVERADSPMRQRFTVAHELGHFIERTVVQKTPDEDFGFIDRRQARVHDAHEFFANEFAANLLMPAVEVRRRYDHNPDAISLAAQFGVSTMALKTRLLKLGLLS